ncbi:galactose oxidase, central domain protein [Leptospira alexanderi serovar Manhao 3 str. L 60]|uniref:Galactose oxidase, central domain protein n=2 Tax=Leptospira alexanderi TaxID=100053 RepID=V6I1K0_9LEPT|nr:kelch repeat-containing protein [Leptospira alexanderi]EQA63247.1 galactose oxidase, central domain protein [Leptospira alexanderi serovar Manhao 3 str. L 60]
MKNRSNYFFLNRFLYIFSIVLLFLQMNCKYEHTPLISNEQLVIIQFLRNVGFQGRFAHSSVKLLDGSVLFCGGTNGMGTIYKSCYSFNEVDNIVKYAGDMNFERTSFAMHLLDSGKVLIAGGAGYDNLLILSLEIYDPLTKSFTIGSKLNFGRVYFASTKLNNGNIFISGGIGVQGQVVKSIEVFNPTSNAITLGNNEMSVGRFYHTATTLDVGNVLIAGGSDGVNSQLSSVELYNPNTGSFSNTGNLLHSRARHTSTLLANGTVLITSGRVIDNATHTSYEPFGEIYVPGTGLFALTTSPLNIPRRSHTSNLLSNGNVIICGGYVFIDNEKISKPTSSCEVFQNTDNKYVKKISLLSPRANPILEVLNSGKLFVFGGIESDGFFVNDINTDNSGELIDLQTNSITITRIFLQ